MCDISPTSYTGATSLFELLSQNSHFPLGLDMRIRYNKDSSGPNHFPFRSLAKNWGVHAKVDVQILISNLDRITT